MLVTLFYDFDEILGQEIEEAVGPLDHPFQSSRCALRLVEGDQLGAQNGVGLISISRTRENQVGRSCPIARSTDDASASGLVSFEAGQVRA